MTVPITKKPITVAALRHGGTHLITPIIRKLTGKTVYSPKGDAALHCIASPIVVVFMRDPRNRIVSNLRYKNEGIWEHWDRGGRDDKLLEFLRSRKQSVSLLPIEYMFQWQQRWQLDPPSRQKLTTRFEIIVDPARGPAEVERIAAMLIEAGLDLVATASEARAYALGQSGTYTGNHSKYRDWFGPKSCAYWKQEFGPELTRRMGYTVDEGLGI